MTFERLSEIDPAVTPDEVTLKRIRRRVHIGRASINPMALVASVAAFALVAGGGVAVGRLTATTNTQAIERIGPGQTSDASRLIGAPSDASRSMAMPWYGQTVLLKPSNSISDSGGTASAYEFQNKNIDQEEFAKALAKIVGATGSVTSMDQGLRIWGGNDRDASVWVSMDEMGHFSAYNSVNSTWAECGKPTSDVTVDTPECQTATEPADKKAVQDAFNKILKLLGLSTSDVVISNQDYGTQAVYNIQAMAKINGQPTNVNRLSVSGSSKGVWSIDGFTAAPAEISGYEIIGAQSAAKRAQLVRWQAFGPAPFGEWMAYGARDAAFSANPRWTVDGKQGFTFNVEEVNVNLAKLGLVQLFNAEGGLRLVPAWIYTADDGRQWSIVAVADKYVKF